jgi:hypothetical protein
VVVFFDEFHEIGGAHQPYGDTDRLTNRMRAIFQRTSGVSYLFAGSLEHPMRELCTPSHPGLHPRSTMLIAQKSHLATVELETRLIDLGVVEQGLLTEMPTDRIAHEQILERSAGRGDSAWWSRTRTVRITRQSRRIMGRERRARGHPAAPRVRPRALLRRARSSMSRGVI